MDFSVFKSAFARDMLTASNPERRDAVRQLLTASSVTSSGDAELRTPCARDADVDAELARARQECARLARENNWLRETAAHEPDAQSLAWRLRGAEQTVEMQRRVLREVAAFLTRAAQPECNRFPSSRAVPSQVTWPRVRRAEPCCHDQQVAAEAFRLLRTVQSLLGITHAPRSETLSPVEEVTSSGGHDESGFSSMSSFLDASPINASPLDDSPCVVGHDAHDSYVDRVQDVSMDASPLNASPLNASSLNASPQSDGFTPLHPEERYDASSTTLAHEIGLPRFRSGLPSRARPQRSLSFSLPRPSGGGALRQSEDFASLRVLWV